MLPRHETWLSMQWFSLTSLRGRQIIIWLALGDLFASLGVFLRSSSKLIDYFAYGDTGFSDNADSDILYCTILVMWTQYFYAVTWCWTLCYAADTWLAVQKRSGYPWLYHCVAWLLPAVLQGSIYFSTGGGCEREETSQLTNYSLVAVVMVSLPILFWLAVRHLHVLAMSCLSQVTNKERSVIRSVRHRFGLIVLAFYVCWLPNLIHGLLLAIWPKGPACLQVALWYMMAVLNPLQALFNSAVYRRPNLKLVTPFKRSQPELSETTPLVQANINSGDLLVS
nr:G-protein coupled receptor 143-like [Halyomorpha halys]